MILKESGYFCKISIIPLFARYSTILRTTTDAGFVETSSLVRANQMSLVLETDMLLE